MKLFVVNRANQKIYLNITAPTRSELQTLIGGNHFSVNDDIYNIQDVNAEMDRNNAATGAVVGGVVGALGGPVGILIGGFLGGLIGNSSDKEELAKVERFNRS